MRLRRRHRRLLLLALLACACMQTSYAETVSDEDVKLALVYKIVRFVTWPATSGEGTRAFRLCVAESQLYARAQERLSGRKIRERPIKVTLLNTDSAEFASQCDVFYMAGVKKEQFIDLLNDAMGAPVLTVSDAADFATSGGMIGLTKRGNKISMKINVSAYETSGFVISSQLLELADLVDDNRRAKR